MTTPKQDQEVREWHKQRAYDSMVHQKTVKRDADREAMTNSIKAVIYIAIVIIGLICMVISAIAS